MKIEASAILKDTPPSESLRQLNASSVNYEALEDLTDDEKSFDTLSSAEISSKTYRIGYPLVKLDPQHGVSTVSPQKKSVSGESAIVTCSNSNLGSCFASSCQSDYDSF